MPRITTSSFTIGHNMPLSREICKICFRVNPIGFSVPDKIWRAVIPKEYQSGEVCLWCFTHLADEKLIPWDNQIEFYPVSMYSHLNNVKDFLAL